MVGVGCPLVRPKAVQNGKTVLSAVKMCTFTAENTAQKLQLPSSLVATVAALHSVSCSLFLSWSSRVTLEEKVI